MIEIGLCESFISIKDEMGFVMLRRIKEGDAKGGGVIIPKDKFQEFVEFSKEMGRRKIGEIGSSSKGGICDIGVRYTGVMRNRNSHLYSPQA